MVRSSVGPVERGPFSSGKCGIIRLRLSDASLLQLQDGGRTSIAHRSKERIVLPQIDGLAQITSTFDVEGDYAK
jgi:hypothetical protein